MAQGIAELDRNLEDWLDDGQIVEEFHDSFAKHLMNMLHLEPGQDDSHKRTAVLQLVTWCSTAGEA